MSAEEMEARLEELRHLNGRLHADLISALGRLDEAQVMINKLFEERLRLEALVASLQGGEE